MHCGVSHRILLFAGWRFHRFGCTRCPSIGRRRLLKFCCLSDPLTASAFAWSMMSRKVFGRRLFGCQALPPTPSDSGFSRRHRARSVSACYRFFTGSLEPPFDSICGCVSTAPRPTHGSHLCASLYPFGDRQYRCAQRAPNLVSGVVLCVASIGSGVRQRQIHHCLRSLPFRPRCVRLFSSLRGPPAQV